MLEHDDCLVLLSWKIAAIPSTERIVALHDLIITQIKRKCNDTILQEKNKMVPLQPFLG